MRLQWLDDEGIFPTITAMLIATNDDMEMLVDERAAVASLPSSQMTSFP